VAVVVPGRSFGSLLGLGVGLIRRFGSSEPTVIHALPRMLLTVLTATGEDPERWADIETEAALLVADAERATAQPADLHIVRTEARRLQNALAGRRSATRVADRPPTDVTRST
jgi:uncharacterized membrane protein